MNPNSVVRLLTAEGKTAGMGFVFARRRVATPSFVVYRALGIEDGSLTQISGATVAFDLPLAQSGKVISGRLVGTSLIEIRFGKEQGVSIIEAEPSSEDILEPTPLISGRTSDSYFDRKIRILVHEHDFEYYITGTLQGQVSGGYIQIVSDSNNIPSSAAGTPIWDVEASSVIGMLYFTWRPGTMGFMIPASRIAEAWPEVDVQPVYGGPGRTKPKVFVCHAHEEAQIALTIYNRLKTFGYDPWIDKEKLLPGQNWDQEIKNAVKQANFFILLLSENSVSKRGYVQKEFRMAIDSMNEMPEGTIYLIPAKLDDCLVPQNFANLQWVELNGEGGFDKIRQAIEFQMSLGK